MFRDIKELVLENRDEILSKKNKTWIEFVRILTFKDFFF